MWDFTVVPGDCSLLSRPPAPYSAELEICSFLRDIDCSDEDLLRFAVECIAVSHGCSVFWSEEV